MHNWKTLCIFAQNFNIDIEEGKKDMYKHRLKPKQIIHLIWLEKDETEINKHEYFSYPSALFDAHNKEELGFSPSTLSNAFSNQKDAKIATFIPRNGKVKIIRGILIDKKKLITQ